MLTITTKIMQNQHIIGCYAVDETFVEHYIEKADLKQYTYTNATITADNKILNCAVPIKQVTTLYHGSHKGIHDSITTRYSRNRCDFGKGFYTGDKPKQAQMLIADDDSGVFYVLHAQLDQLKVYTFTDNVLWALYVGVNRGHIDVKQYPKLKTLCKQIDDYDVVAGLIADDKMMFVYMQFIAGLITDKALIACLQQVKLGKQYTFKNDAVCQAITIVRSEHLTEQMKTLCKKEKQGTLLNINSTVEYLIRTYRRQGKYIDEILENFK